MPGFEEVGMLNALVWALACFGVVAADIALSMVLFSVLDIVSALTGSRSTTSISNGSRLPLRRRRF